MYKSHDGLSAGELIYVEWDSEVDWPPFPEFGGMKWIHHGTTRMILS